MIRNSFIVTVIILLAASLTGCGGGAVVFPPVDLTGDINLIIANSLGETISIASRTDGQWSIQTDVVPTGQGANDIAVHGNRAYIVNSLSNSIHVVDTDTMATVREISTGAGTNPFAVVLDDEGNLWVTLMLANQLLRIDPDAAEPIMATINLPSADQFDDDDASDDNMPWPGGLCYLDGKVYVAFSNLNSSYVAGGAGAVAIVDAASYSVEELLTISGRNTVGVECPDPSSGLVYFVSAGDYSLDTFSYMLNGLVEVYDTSTGQVIDSVSLMGAPFEMVVGEAGAAFLTDGSTNQMLRFDLNSRTVWPPIPVPDSGTGFNYVSGLCYIGGNEIAVLEFNSDTLYIIDGITGEIKWSASAGDGPDAIAIIL